MSENRINPDLFDLSGLKHLSKLSIAIEKAVQLSQPKNMIAIEKCEFVQANKGISVVWPYNSFNENSKIFSSPEHSIYENLFSGEEIKKYLEAQDSFYDNDLTDEKIIPHLINKLVTKLIEESSTNNFETYSFVSENITTFFYYNKNFTAEEVEFLNNEINEKLIHLTPFFGIDELLKFTFIVTAEDLSDKEKSVTYGMPCG